MSVSERLVISLDPFAWGTRWTKDIQRNKASRQRLKFNTTSFICSDSGFVGYFLSLLRQGNKKKKKSE